MSAKRKCVFSSGNGPNNQQGGVIFGYHTRYKGQLDKVCIMNLMTSSNKNKFSPGKSYYYTSSPELLMKTTYGS